MKRSEINNAISEALSFFKQHCVALPAWAYYTLEDFRQQNKSKGVDFSAVVASGCGWDVTSFGDPEFKKKGLVLVTTRNGIPASVRAAKCPHAPALPYCEKVMYATEGQVTPMHCHRLKTEDIIVRAGASLRVKLVNRHKDRLEPDPAAPVLVAVDGILHTFESGDNAVVELAPGQSISLTPGMFHTFAPTGPCLIGEVSTVNDDAGDNIFAGGEPRWGAIDEDEPIKIPLTSDVAKLNL